MTSFDFTWNNVTKPMGKVFARKKATKNAEKPKEKETSPSVPKLNSIKTKQPQIVQNKPSEEQSETNLGSSSLGYVKRKQKKDKLAAKAQESGESAPQINTESGNKSTKTSYSLFAIKHKDIYVNTNIKGKSVVEKVFSGDGKFSDLNIHKYLVSNLQKHNFTTLTNVQEKSIPVILTGKNVLVSQ